MSNKDLKSIYLVMIDVSQDEERYAEHEDLNAFREENFPHEWVDEIFEDYAEAEAYIQKCAKAYDDLRERKSKPNFKESIDDSDIYHPDCYRIDERKLHLSKNKRKTK